MDEIIQIVIFIAAMGISLLVQQKTKANKKPTTPSPQEVLEEMFPEINQPQETEFVQPISVTKPTNKKRTSLQIKTKTNKPSATSTIHSPKEVFQPTKKISLNSKEEARRAFIYSEIFNRKY